MWICGFFRSAPPDGALLGDPLATQGNRAVDVLVGKDGVLVAPVEVQGARGPVLQRAVLVVLQGDVDALERIRGELVVVVPPRVVGGHAPVLVQDTRRIALDGVEVPFADRLVEAPRHEDLRAQAAGRRVGGRPEVVSGRIAQGRLLSHDTHGRGQRFVAFQGFPERLERPVPPPGGLEHAEALPRVVEDVARVGIGVDRVLVAGKGAGPISRYGPKGASQNWTCPPFRRRPCCRRPRYRAGSASRKTRRPMLCQMLPRNLTRPAWGSCRREPRTKL